MHHNVVRAVQLLPAVVAGRYRYAAVRLDARQSARRVLAADQPSFTVPGKAVGRVAELTKGADAVPRVPLKYRLTGGLVSSTYIDQRKPARDPLYRSLARRSADRTTRLGTSDSTKGACDALADVATSWT